MPRSAAGSTGGHISQSLHPADLGTLPSSHAYLWPLSFALTMADTLHRAPGHGTQKLTAIPGKSPQVPTQNGENTGVG